MVRRTTSRNRARKAPEVKQEESKLVKSEFLCKVKEEFKESECIKQESVKQEINSPTDNFKQSLFVQKEEPIQSFQTINTYLTSKLRPEDSKQRKTIETSHENLNNFSSNIPFSQLSHTQYPSQSAYQFLPIPYIPNKTKKRGRPEKIISIPTPQLHAHLATALSIATKKICEGEKYEFRADTLRVRLIRLAKKIPLMLLHLLHSKSKYKSNMVAHFKEAYLNTYRRFLEILEFKGIEKVEFWEEFEDGEPRYFLEF
jgi:hypothetical protein